MSFLRSLFNGVIGVLAFMAFLYLWASWSVDEVSTFRTAFHGGVTPPPKFVCNTHLAADAGKNTLDWRCDALNAVCRHGVQNACQRVAAFNPNLETLAPRAPASSLLPDPAFANQLRFTTEPKEGASLGFQRKVYRGSINDNPHISPDQLARDRSDGGQPK